MSPSCELSVAVVTEEQLEDVEPDRARIDGAGVLRKLLPDANGWPNVAFWKDRVGVGERCRDIVGGVGWVGLRPGVLIEAVLIASLRENGVLLNRLAVRIFQFFN